MFVFPTAKPALLGALTILDEAFGKYAFVSAKLPRHARPDNFVRVTRIGGARDNIATDAARILVECYAKDVAQVESMCISASAALANAAGTTITVDNVTMSIRSWEEISLVTDYPNPDVLEHERGQVTGTLYIKAN